MKRAQVAQDGAHTRQSKHLHLLQELCFLFFHFHFAIWKCSPQEWNIRLFKCWAAELQPGGTFPGACLVKSLETDGNNGIKLFLSFFYLFSLSCLYFSFLGMHRNISLSCWWKWPCSNDGNGPQLAAPVQCIISLNEFAPVPAHQPSPAPSKGQAVPQLWDWKQIEGGCWTVLRVLGFVKTWYLVKCIWSLAWSNSSEKDIF